MVRGRQQTDTRDAGRQASAQRLVIGLVGLIRAVSEGSGICRPYTAKIKSGNRFKNERWVSIVLMLVCRTICPKAIPGPSNGAALVSLERGVDVESLYVDIIY